jgi:FixJ family two-component response regulator
MQGEKPTIAIVDDDASVRTALGRFLRSHAYRLELFGSGSEFLARYVETRSVCVVLDQHMPDLEGLDVLLSLRERGVHLPVIMITGFDQPGLRQRCLEAGALDYLVKPIVGRKFLDAVRAATETQNGKNADTR